MQRKSVPDLKLSEDAPADVSIQEKKIEKSGNTPPPSPSVILYTLHPTVMPTEEPESVKRGTVLGEIKPLRKATTPVDVSIQDAKTHKDGNTPPPSPSVIKYTLHPTVMPTEESYTSSPSEETSRKMFEARR